MKVDGRPYIQVGDGNSFTRVFSNLEDSQEFKWHRDERDRIVTILSGEGWSLQFDDAIPVRLSIGDRVKIVADRWHRVIPGVSPLEILIEEGC